MEATLALLCDYANVSSDGKLNILGIFTDVNATGLPAVLPTFYLVTSFSAGAAEAGGERTITVVLVNADGGQLGRFSQKVTVPSPARPGSRAILNQVGRLDGVVLPKAGAYSFSIQVDGDEKIAVALHVSAPIAQT